METLKYIIIILVICLIIVTSLFIYIIYPYTLNQDRITFALSYITIYEKTNNIEFIAKIDSKYNNNIVRNAGIINFISNETDAYSLWLRDGNLNAIELFRLKYNAYGDYTASPHPIELYTILTEDIEGNYKIKIYNETIHGFSLNVYKDENLIISYYSDEPNFSDRILFGSYSNVQNNGSYGAIVFEVGNVTLSGS